MFKKLIIYTCVFAPLMLGACGLETYQSCDLPASNRLSTIKTNTHTKEQVLRILGTPTFEQADENFLIYARSRKKSQAFMDPKEFERDVYVYYFDDNNILTKQEHLTLADANSVSFDAEQTPTQHRELSVTDQLIQNFGRYDAGGRDSTSR